MPSVWWCCEGALIEGVRDGRFSSVRSALLPTRMVVRLGEASARASSRKVCRPAKDGREERSYTRRAPAAPR